MSSAAAGQSRETSGHPRVALMTMVRDEASLLPRWIDYYGRQLGIESLVVLDDNSVDGSTDDLPCTTYRLPAGPWKQSWGRTRTSLVNSFARGLLACNDVVVFTDVDEFLVPDPARHAGLLDYLAHRADRRVVAPVAVELVHHPDLEPDLDPGRPVLEQRRFVKFSPGMCKPLVKRRPASWRQAFHAIEAPFEVDPDLLLLHLKYHDRATMLSVAEQRLRAHEDQGRGSAASAWSMGPAALAAMVDSWTSGTGGGAVDRFDPAGLDVAGLIRERADGSWKSTANQVAALDGHPLTELPNRFRQAF